MREPSVPLARLAPLGDKFRGRKPVTLEFEWEDAALRVLFLLGDEAEIVSPKTLRRKLHQQAKRVLQATA